MKEVVAAALAVIGLIVVVGVLVTLPVMWLWNWLMPDIFGLQEIGFWQALGISILSKCLFSSTPSSKS